MAQGLIKIVISEKKRKKEEEKRKENLVQKNKMAKVKVLKLYLGEVYDKDTKKSLPVNVTFWEQKDGSYKADLRVFVNEVEVADKEQKQSKIEA